MKIEVKKTHIRRGKQRRPDSCPIALAIKESLGVTNVQVWNDTIDIGKKSFDIPYDAEAFIEQFDECKKNAEPFTFEL